MTGTELEGRVALVTGGGRGIGRGIALELAAAGAKVAAAARSAEQVAETAALTGGIAFTADVSDRLAVEAMVRETQERLGPIDLLVNDAAVSGPPEPIWEQEPADWWRVFEINVLGAYLCCRAVLPGMVERRRGRIVNVGSGAGYLARSATGTAYAASKAALNRFGEALAASVAQHGISVFTISPGLVRTAMTARFPADAPWTPPELAPRLVRALASGRLDALSGRYVHAEHDDVENLAARAEQIVRDDLNTIRLRR